MMRGPIRKGASIAVLGVVALVATACTGGGGDVSGRRRG